MHEESRSGVRAIMALGLAWVLALVLATPPGVHFSGDGSVKELMVARLASGHLDLELPAPPWVRELWDAGLFPFDAPFAYLVGGKHVPVFPLPFVVLSLPGYLLAGSRGLFLVPVLGLVATWLGFVRAAARLGLSRRTTELALAGLVFASPLTLYGAIVWEHTVAVALVVWGLALGLDPLAGRGRLVGAGALLGAAFAFRPEAIVPAAGVLGALPFAAPGRLRRAGALGLGVALAVGAFLATNLWLYGRPLGLHGLQVTGPDATRRSVVVLGAARLLLSELATTTPLVGFLALACLVVPVRGDRRLALVALPALATLVGVPLIVPHGGGLQWGPRYLFGAVPLLFLSAAVLWERRETLAPALRRSLALVLACCLAGGAWVNVVRGTRAHLGQVRHSMREGPELVLARGVACIVAREQTCLHGLIDRPAERFYFLADSDARFERLVRGLAAAGQREFLLLGHEGDKRQDYGYEAPGGGPRVVIRFVAESGMLVVFHARFVTAR